MNPRTNPNLTPFLIAEAAQRKAVKARARRLRKKTLAATLAPAGSNTASPPLLAPLRSKRQQLGDHYECQAWEILEKAGCRLIARQLSCPLGELDLVVCDNQTLVFVEVRYRSNSRFGGAAASVTTTKQARLLKAIHWWLPTLVRRTFAGQMPPCRIDLLTFDSSGTTWHRDAVRLRQDK